MTTVGVPSDLNLPFFAYGIFRSNELAWPRIQDVVETAERSRLVDWVIRLRNGLPVLIEQAGGSVEGDCVYFSNPIVGYQAVGGSEPSGEYKWQTLITEAGNRCNALIAVKPKRGVSDEPIFGWTSADDPSFVHGMAAVAAAVTEVRVGLIEKKPWLDTPSDWDAFFRLQGAFLVLWSIIERLASFRFGAEFVQVGNSSTTTGKIYELATVDEFRDAMRRAEIRSQTVYSVRENRAKRSLSNGEIDDLLKSTETTLRAWYQIRSNITHRGKSASSDNQTVLNATVDLFNTTYLYLDAVMPGIRSKWEERGVCMLPQELDSSDK